MKYYLQMNACRLIQSHGIYCALIVLFTAFSQSSSAQQSTVLPGNGSFSQSSGPQGALRSQRGFYLIAPKEMQTSGLTNGSPINSIGFTIGSAQDTTTKGSFKVYLQNTNDTVSRVDTNWTIVTVSTNSYTANGLVPGTYEWQVRTNCTTPSAYSPSLGFTNDNVGPCSPPTNLSTTNITATSATFNWVAPSSLSVSKYYVEYKHQDSANYKLDSSTTLSYNATSLAPNKFYQWRVRTICSGSNSTNTGASFITNMLNSCNVPGSLATGTITNISAAVSWTAATGASYYTIQYRRQGTTSWISNIAFTTAYTINGLIAGTAYEWQVRTVCPAGSGAFISGPNFSTTGTAACYAPANLSTNSITDSSAVFLFDAVPGNSSYTVRYRLKESISWTNAITPMTAVHHDSLTIPDTVGQYTVPFANGSAFTYTGNGVYVAWEYSNATNSLSSANTTISTTANTVVKGSAGQDSIKYTLSLIASGKNNGSVLPTTLTGTDQRPETRFGSATLRDSVAVVAVYALGFTAPPYQSPTPVSALIKNNSTTTNNYPVTLTVKDQQTKAVRYTITQNISVNGLATGIISFNAWSPSLYEKDSLIVSVPAQPGENVINNNSNFYLQTVNPAVIAYDDGTSAISAAGHDTLAGLLLNRHQMKGCGKVNAAQVFLTETAVGHPVYAVVRNATGIIVAQSPAFTPDSSAVNAYHNFYFTSPPSLQNEDFYIGLAQTASTTGFFPVGVQYENNTRAQAYYKASLDGTNLIDYPQQGRLMIRAEIIPSFPVPFISGKLSLCTNASNTLTAASSNTRYASSVLQYSSQYSNALYSSLQALGTPNVYPANTFSADAWIPGTADSQREFLVLGYSNPAPVSFVDVYETTNPGAIDTVYVKNPNTGNYEVVYTATAAPAPPAANIRHITFPVTSFNVSEIRLALNSTVVPGFNAIDAVGIGETKDPATYSTYLWSPGGQTTQSITVNTPGTYTLTVTNGTGCSQTASATVYAAVQVVPTITATRPTTFCQGDSTILKSSQKGGNTWSTGATTDSIKVKTGGTYTVSYNDGSGCGPVTSAPTVVTVNALPAVDITGTLSFCPGGSTTLNAGGGYSSYLWSTGAITQTITTTTAGSYFVKVTNSNGCKASDTVAVTVGASLSPAITGNLSFCPGGSTTLDAGDGYTSYSWSTGATTRTINVNTAGTFSVSVTNASGCSGSASATTSLYTPPAPVISGSLIFCPGSSTTLDAGAGYNSYLWSTGASTRTITVNTPGNYTVTVRNSNGCSGSASVSTSTYTPPAPVISGPTVFCQGSSTTLTASTGYNSYHWSNGSASASTNITASGNYTVTVTDNNGCTGSTSVAVTQLTPPSPVITGATTFCGGGSGSTTLDAGSGYNSYAWSTGATTRSILVTAVGTYTVTVRDNNGCPGSASVTTSQTGSIPNTPGPISGPTVGICNSTGNVYSISAVPGASHYVWTVPTGATITSGQTNMVGGTSITVSYGPSFTSGNIVVAASNSCGQSGSVNPRTLAVGGTAGTPGAITGQTTGLCNLTNKQYSIAAVSNATSYTWTLPSGANFVSGQGTTTVTISFVSSFSTGTICVKSNTTCGSSANACLTLNALPVITAGISGPTTVCSKQQGIVYSVPVAPGASTYTWTVPAQATITSGLNSNSITVKFGTKGGDVTVKANNACGSTPIQSLTVAMGNCAATISAKSGSNAIETIEQGLRARVLPNPFSTHFTLITQSSNSEPVNIKITDASGRTIGLKSGVAANGTHMLGQQYRPGMYYLEVMQGKEKITMKLIKQ